MKKARIALDFSPPICYSFRYQGEGDRDGLRFVKLRRVFMGAGTKDRKLHTTSGFMNDRALSKEDKEIVWYADDKILRTLVYCVTNKHWALQGYISVAMSSGKSVHGSSVYHRGIGYVYPAIATYAIFDANTDDQTWQEAYEEFAENIANCSISGICQAIGLSGCRCMR